MSREIKDSGVEWIGEIPKDWEVSKIKRIARIYTGNSIKDNEKENYTNYENSIPYIPTKAIDVNNSVIDYNNGLYIPLDDINFKIAKKGSILVCIEGGSAGKKIAYLNQDVCFVNKLCCFESINFNNKYLYYYIKSPAFSNEFSLHISGLIGGVSQGEIKEFSIAIPSLLEQQKIANFLDEKVGEIDRLIDNAKKSIEEYKKYKQSVITEAVTKGLDSNVEMKYSGIEWIGEIPKHWEINIINQIFLNLKNKNINLQEKNLLSLSYGKIIRKNIKDNTGLLPENFTGYNIIEKNDIVLRLTDLQNDHKSLRVGRAEERGIITSAYITLRPRKNIDTRYYYRFLHTFDVYKGFYGMGSGVRQGLNFDELKYLKIVNPPVYEQNKIANYLDLKCNEIDNLISKKEQLISELESYKKSIIYEYVTGKKEV